MRASGGLHLAASKSKREIPIDVLDVRDDELDRHVALTQPHQELNNMFRCSALLEQFMLGEAPIEFQ